MDIYARQLAKAAYKKAESGGGGGGSYTKAESDARFVAKADLVVLTQAQYDALPSIDPDVFYFITG